MTPPLRVLSVFGTRPEAIKMAPVARLLARTEGIEAKILVTAQHREMLDSVLELFQLKPDLDLNLMRPGQDLYDLTARVLVGTRDALAELALDLILVHGDTTTTFTVSLAGYYAQIPVGHVEAGLRTGNKFSPFPEESNRRLTGCLADLHFAPTSRARENLVRENIDARHVPITGNTAIDALLWMKGQNTEPSGGDIDAIREELGEDRPLVLITAHRRESFGEGFENICGALHDLALAFPETLFVYPVHLNPNVQEPVKRVLGEAQNIRLIEPVSYDPFVWLMSRSTLILTDSGGVQEEAPSLGKPVLVLRDTTERPEAVEAGTVSLVGSERKTIVREATRLLSDPSAREEMGRRINPYGDGRAAERIVDAILKWSDRPSQYDPPPFAPSQDRGTA